MIPPILLHWLWIHAGLNSANSPWYLFWSGIGADWTRLLAFGGFLKVTHTMSRHHRERVEQRERHHQEILSRDIPRT